MILAMYEQNANFDFISKVSGLSQEDVENIINDSKSK